MQDSRQQDQDLVVRGARASRPSHRLRYIQFSSLKCFQYWLHSSYYRWHILCTAEHQAWFESNRHFKCVSVSECVMLIVTTAASTRDRMIQRLPSCSAYLRITTLCFCDYSALEIRNKTNSRVGNNRREKERTEQRKEKLQWEDYFLIDWCTCDHKGNKMATGGRSLVKSNRQRVTKPFVVCSTRLWLNSSNHNEQSGHADPGTAVSASNSLGRVGSTYIYLTLIFKTNKIAKDPFNLNATV